jgi:uncharacterized Zn-binding protein involved in type VI secretion
MPPAARVTDNHVCPRVDPPPHVGGPIQPSCSTDTIIGYLNAARMGDKAICIGDGTDMILLGSPTVYINNKMAARKNDPMLHGGKIVQGCDTVIIGDEGGSTYECACQMAASGALGSPNVTPPPTPPASSFLPSAPPANPGAAPPTMTLPPGVQNDLQKMWNDTAATGTEHGGTLVDKGGDVGIANIHDSADPMHTVNAYHAPPGTDIIGDVHTHPLDPAGYVTFSAKDISNALSNPVQAMVLQSGDTQYAMMPTQGAPLYSGATPPTVAQLQGQIDARQADLQLNHGYAAGAAYNQAAQEVATNNGLAYYAGKGGVLNRVP